jgi:uracil-DNA glycosylase
MLLLMVLVSLPVHSSWKEILEPLEGEIKRLLSEVANQEIAPTYENIFKALELDANRVKVVIFGQDPYPTPGYATGLAFSVPRNSVIPASLRNIYQELGDDLNMTPPAHGDLTSWANEGVLLLNRVLTTRLGAPGSHTKLGWQKISDHIASELGRRGVVAILWGKNASELSGYFSHSVSSPHPSPLSAYRGFFGSKPFSRVNQILHDRSQLQIDWTVK